MKKIISCVLVCCLMLSLVPFTVYADSPLSEKNIVSETTKVLEDGTIITITVVDETNPLARATSIKTQTFHKTL